MHCNLEGKVALVTGGGGVIGSAIAQQLASAGARVAVSDLVWAQGRAPSGSAREFLCLDHDVASPEQWRRVVNVVEQTIGPIDILCNSAGIRPESTPVADIAVADWNRAFAVNATGVLLGCQAVLPAMQNRRRGTIVNIASTVGKESLAGSAAYGASKHAVIAITQSLAREVGTYNINVNAICPGPIRSPLLLDSDDEEALRELEARLGALTPLNRIPQPKDVASLVVFLVSDQARNIHGQSINIDCGRSTHI